MRSFAVVAGFAAAANAAVYGYPAQNATSVAPPTYPAVSSPAGYKPASSSVGYPSYTTTTVTGLTTVCNGPTTISVGTKTYTVTKSTTLIDTACVYTTTVPVKPASTPVAPGYTPVAPAPPAGPYPSKNGTAPTYPVGTATPVATKPAPSQFTGAAAQTGAAMLAVAAGLVAFL